MKSENELNRLFYPQSVAVVGASPKSGKGWSSGNAYIAGFLKQGYRGRIYPVHPSAESILGFKSYRSIRDIPDDIDLAVFTVPSSAVLELMEECVEKGVKFTHFLTAGFSETGLGGQADLEQRLTQAAAKGGVRILGPNCMGVYCPEGGVSWSADFPVNQGSVGFFSQSGQLAYNFIFSGQNFGLSFSKVVSFGNAVDLQQHDFLSYFSNDDKTEVVAAYLEGFKDGRRFLEAARETTKHKPLVVWKGGVTEAGSRAVRSHTAALAGSPEMWQAVCRQAGIIPVGSLEELILTVLGLKRLPMPKGKGLAIIGGAGGGSVTMTDIIEREGLTAPRLADKTIKGFGEFVPVEGTSVQNPLDIIPYIQAPDNLKKTMELLQEDPNIDAILFSAPAGFLYQRLGRVGLNMFYQFIKSTSESLTKPLLIVLERNYDPKMDQIQLEAQEWFSSMGLASFPSVQAAARALNKIYQYSVYLNR